FADFLALRSGLLDLRAIGALQDAGDALSHDAAGVGSFVFRLRLGGLRLGFRLGRRFRRRDGGAQRQRDFRRRVDGLAGAFGEAADGLGDVARGRRALFVVSEAL